MRVITRRVTTNMHSVNKYVCLLKTQGYRAELYNRLETKRLKSMMKKTPQRSPGMASSGDEENTDVNKVSFIEEGGDAKVNLRFTLGPGAHCYRDLHEATFGYIWLY